MSTTDGLWRGVPHSALAVIRRTFVHLATWIAALARPPRVGERRLFPATVRLVAGLAVAAVAIVATMAFVDAWAYEQARRLPRGIVAVFNEITDFGKSGWFLWPLGVLLVVVAAIESPALSRLTNLVLVSMAVRLGFLFAAISIPGIVASLVKNMIGRRRPSDLGPWLYAPFTWKPAFSSMPSGHSTTAFAVAIAFGAVFPRARLVLWIYAGIIALSRIVITAHFPSDVLAGALVGACGALIVRNWFAARGLGFVFAPDGSVLARPGPSWRRLKRVAGRVAGY